MQHAVRAEPWGCGSSGAVDEGAAAGHRLALMIGSGAIGTAACVSIERCGAAAGQRWHALGRPPRADSAVPAADECTGVAVRPLLAQGRQQACHCRHTADGSLWLALTAAAAPRSPPPPSARSVRARACAPYGCGCGCVLRSAATARRSRGHRCGAAAVALRYGAVPPPPALLEGTDVLQPPSAPPTRAPPPAAMRSAAPRRRSFGDADDAGTAAVRGERAAGPMRDEVRGPINAS